MAQSVNADELNSNSQTKDGRSQSEAQVDLTDIQQSSESTGVNSPANIFQNTTINPVGQGSLHLPKTGLQQGETTAECPTPEISIGVTAAGSNSPSFGNTYAGGAFLQFPLNTGNCKEVEQEIAERARLKTLESYVSICADIRSNNLKVDYEALGNPRLKEVCQAISKE